MYCGNLVESRIQGARESVSSSARSTPEMREEYDFVVWATYGLGPSRGLFKSAKYQVAEKILIQLAASLHRISLVVVDGPFTAFDPYGSSGRSLFGRRKIRIIGPLPTRRTSYRPATPAC